MLICQISVAFVTAITLCNCSNTYVIPIYFMLIRCWKTGYFSPWCTARPIAVRVYASFARDKTRSTFLSAKRTKKYANTAPIWTYTLIINRASMTRLYNDSVPDSLYSLKDPLLHILKHLLHTLNRSLGGSAFRVHKRRTKTRSATCLTAVGQVAFISGGNWDIYERLRSL